MLSKLDISSNWNVFHRINDGCVARPVNTSVTAKQASNMLVLLCSLGLFHGHYHQHVKQSCERTSDAVNENGDDKTHLEWDIWCVALYGCRRVRLGGYVCNI